jgi:uncharacterized protein
MKRIGLLSDTHGYLDQRIIEHLEVCDEIWHAGDIGSLEVLTRLETLKTLRAVYGNIDGQPIRISLQLMQRFVCEEVDVLIKHIGGYPGKYDSSILPIIQKNPPKLLIAGHSHILKVMYDKKNKFLFINPGAAGISGFHHIRTLVRFTLDKSNIGDLEVVELGKRN